MLSFLLGHLFATALGIGLVGRLLRRRSGPPAPEREREFWDRPEAAFSFPAAAVKYNSCYSKSIHVSPGFALQYVYNL